MNLFKLSRVLLFCIAASFISVSVLAETLKVGLGELDYPPFYFKKNNKLVGAAIEISEAVSERAGYKLSYHRVPWKRLQHMLKNGSLDMVILYFKTKEREKDVYYTNTPHIYENSSVVIPKGLKVEFNGSILSLAKYDIFYVRGYSHGKEFDSSTILKKHDVNNEAELLSRVSGARPFIGVGNKPALLLHAQRANLQDKIEFLSPPFDHGENYMAFSKQRVDAEKLANRFSAEFRKYSSTPEYKSILMKYGFTQ